MVWHRLRRRRPRAHPSELRAERENPIGAATGVPSGSGAFAGHTLSQRSLTGCPLGPALPEVRCRPGFSPLERTSVNRLTFKSRTGPARPTLWCAGIPELPDDSAFQLLFLVLAKPV